MPQVSVAGIADGFDPLHPGGSVEVVGDGSRIKRLCEGGPSGVGLELFVGIEEECGAACTGVETGLKEAAHLGAEGALGAGLAGDVVFLVGQDLPPFGVGFYYFLRGLGVAVFGEVENVRPFEHPLHGIAFEP